MFLNAWRRWLQGSKKRPIRGRRTYRPSFDSLEDRTLPSTFTVLNTLNSGTGSFRQAILDANAHANTLNPGSAPDQIVFNIAATDPNHVYYRNDGVAGQLSQANIAVTTASNDAAIADIDPDWQHSWWSIRPTAFFPTITDPVVIDASTQPGSSPNTLAVGTNAVLAVELNGINLPLINGLNTDGLDISAPNCTVRGLVINKYAMFGISLDSAGGAQIVGNFIGTDTSGTVARGNGFDGITLARNASNVTIGGTSLADRNLLSGNLGSGIADGDAAGDYTNSGLVVQGNLIGTNAAGTAALANGGFGIFLSNVTNSFIGGTAPGAGNVISGNNGDGVFIKGRNGTSANITIQGNFIGTNATGTAAVQNQVDGIGLFSGVTASASGVVTNITIGGTTATARNIISGNHGLGISIGNGETSTTNVVVQGNYIGTNATGTVAIANLQGGVEIKSPSNTVGGTASGAGNLISGNTGSSGAVGIRVRGGDGTVIQGNLIGTDVTGALALPNQVGIILSVSTHVTVGGATAAARNVISGNLGDGVFIDNFQVGNRLQGNYIGTNAGGSLTDSTLGNGGSGVDWAIAVVDNSSLPSHDNLIGGPNPGEGNLIAFNRGNGVSVSGAGLDSPLHGSIDSNTIFANRGKGIILSNSVYGNPHDRITRNSIYANGAIGIDLFSFGDPVNHVTANDSLGHSGVNLFQNFPVLTSAITSGNSTTITGTLDSLATGPFSIEFFSNDSADSSGFGEGQTYLGSTTVTTNGSGHASFSVTLPGSTSGKLITATATDAVGNTSEFSQVLATTTIFVPPAVTRPNNQGDVEGMPQSFDLGSFSDPDGGPWTVSVAWGDNMSTVFQTSSPGSLTGSHTYAEEVTRTVSVTVTDNADQQSDSTSFQVSVTDPAVVAAGGATLTTTYGDEVGGASMSLATFSDPGGAEPNSGDSGALASHYTATIDWGDGSPTETGAITFSGAPGGQTDPFTVTGPAHRYDAGSFTIMVTIDHEGVLSTATTPVVIDKADMYVSANDNSKAYGETATDTGTLSGVLNNDGITASFASSGDGAGSSVGNYTISATLADPNGRLGNYVVHETDANLTVSPADLYVTAAPNSKTYGAVASDVGTLTGVLNNDGITASFASAGDTAGAGVGSYLIAATLADPNGKLGNYVVRETDADLAVNPADLYVVVNDDHTCEGESTTDSGSLVGTVNDDDITAIFSSPGDSAALVGTFAVTATLNDPNGKVGNYMVHETDAVLTVGNIAPTVLSITATPSDTIIAGASEVTVSGTWSDPGSGESYSGTVYWGDFTSSLITVNADGTYSSGSHIYANAGSYTISVVIDDNNGPTDPQCGDSSGSLSMTVSVVPSSFNPTLSTKASYIITNGEVRLTDTATLSGSNDPTGAITFTLHAPDGSIASNQSVSVHGNGSYTTPSYVVATRAGTYWWSAVYSGDSNNTSVSDNLDDASTLEQTTTTVQTTGGLTIGFWSNKNGQALETITDFSKLDTLNLRTANGGLETFSTAAGALASDKASLASWLKGATANNMAYMLSAQLAALQLNVDHGLVDASAYVDCVLISTAYNTFGSASALIAALNSQGALTDAYGIVQISALMNTAVSKLGTTAGANTTAGSALRSFEEALKDVFDAINNGAAIILV